MKDAVIKKRNFNLKNISWIAAAAVILVTIFMLQVPDKTYAAAVEVSGSGTKEDPYLVGTYETFAAYLPQGYVKLTNDISLKWSLMRYESSKNKSLGIDLNGHILDFSECDLYYGICIRAESDAYIDFTISDSNPTSVHDEKYTLSDGTPIYGGILTGYSYSGMGGGVTSCIYLKVDEFTMTGGTFYNNTSGGGGTCLGIMATAKAHISNVNFYNNTCQYWCSGIWFDNEDADDSSELTVSNCNFIGNYGAYSGVIYAESANTQTLIDNCTIKNNKSARYGQVRVSGGGTMIIKDTVITDNETTESGQIAGVDTNRDSYIESYIELDGKVIIKNNTVDGEERNVYVYGPIVLRSGFSSDSEVGVYYRDTLYEGYEYNIVSNIGKFSSCFTSDVPTGEL